jgi:uncharacterized protein YcbX
MLVHLLWAAVAVYAVYRLSAVLERFAPVRSAPEDLVAPLVEVPEDLVAVAMQERESWAQEETLRAIRERYEELKDWNRVRAAIGIGRID